MQKCPTPPPYLNADTRYPRNDFVPPTRLRKGHNVDITMEKPVAWQHWCTSTYKWDGGIGASRRSYSLTPLSLIHTHTHTHDIQTNGVEKVGEINRANWTPSLLLLRLCFEPSSYTTTKRRDADDNKRQEKALRDRMEAGGCSLHILLKKRGWLHLEDRQIAAEVLETKFTKGSCCEIESNWVKLSLRPLLELVATTNTTKDLIRTVSIYMCAVCIHAGAYIYIYIFVHMPEYEYICVT